MRYYPIFVNLENKPCLVVGAGGVGKRKIGTLLDAGAAPVTVIDTGPADTDMEALLLRGDVSFQCRQFEDTDLDGKFMVIACTSNETVNQRIADGCARRGILCNIADQPEAGSFIVPSTIERGDLTLAVSTSGKSPALTKRIRLQLQNEFGDEYALLLRLMGDIRPLMLALGLPTEDNTAVFRALTGPELLGALKLHNLDAAGEILKESLPQPLHANIPELLNGLA